MSSAAPIDRRTARDRDVGGRPARNDPAEYSRDRASD